MHEPNLTEVCIARACWLEIEKIQAEPGAQHKDMPKIGEIMFYAKKHKLEEGDLSIFCEYRLRRIVHGLFEFYTKHTLPLFWYGNRLSEIVKKDCFKSEGFFNDSSKRILLLTACFS